MESTTPCSRFGLRFAVWSVNAKTDTLASKLRTQMQRHPVATSGAAFGGEPVGVACQETAGTPDRTARVNVHFIP